MNISNFLELIELLKVLNVGYFPDGYDLCVVPDPDTCVEYVFNVADSLCNSISIDNLRELFDLLNSLCLEYTVFDGEIEVIAYPSEAAFIVTFHF